MPLETIACAACGSTDVQEVKPGTYFCNHCETVFKHIDPTRLAVEQTPAFCGCGNPIQVQCQICKAGICTSCDLASWDGPGDREDISAAYGTDRSRFTVEGFGYLIRGYPPDRSVYGPYLYLDEVFAGLAAENGWDYSPGYAPVRHACFTCVASAIPVTADRIANGQICETPGCAREPGGTCSCCGGAFCGTHVTPDVLRGQGRLHYGFVETVLITYEDTEPMFRHKTKRTLERGTPVTWYPPAGMCLICVNEKAGEALSAAIRVCEGEYAGSLTRIDFRADEFTGPPNMMRANFMVATADRMTAKRRRQATMEAMKESGAVAAKVGSRLKELVVPGSCRRGQIFDAGEYFATYGIKDERQTMTPVATAAERRRP